MAFTVSEIKTALSKGGARPSLFEISGLSTGAPQMYYIRGGQLPGSNLGVLTTNWRGRPVKYPGVKTYDPWTATILNDDGAFRTEIYDWIQRMSGDHLNVRSGAVGAHLGKFVTTDYKDITIKQLGKQGNTTFTYTLQNAFPTALGDIALDWGTEGFQEYSVTFRYDTFIAGAGDGTTKHIADAVVV